MTIAVVVLSVALVALWLEFIHFHRSVEKSETAIWREIRDIKSSSKGEA